MLVKDITPYQRSSRPALPQSLPGYIDVELQKVAVTFNHILQALAALDERIAALEAP